MPKSCQEICWEMPQIPMFLDQHATLRTWLALAVRVGHRRLKLRVACGRVSILAAPFSRRCRRRRRPSASGPGRRRTSAACTAHRPLAHIGRLHRRRTSAACTVGAHRPLAKRLPFGSVQEPKIQRKQDFWLLALLLGLDCCEGFGKFLVTALERALESISRLLHRKFEPRRRTYRQLGSAGCAELQKTPWCEFCKPSENLHTIFSTVTLWNHSKQCSRIFRHEYAS